MVGELLAAGLDDHGHSFANSDDDTKRDVDHLALAVTWSMHFSSRHIRHGPNAI